MQSIRTKTLKNILASVFILFVLAVPGLVFAEGFIVCGDIAAGQHECGYADLFVLINKVINWIIMISIPISAGVFAWAGLNMMINADNPGKRKELIEMMKKVFIGFVVILSAWIIVNTVTNTLLKEDFKKAVPVEGTKK